MLRNIVAVAVLLIGTAFSLQARASYWFKVSDASQIQYIIANGTTEQIFLRNLSQFDATVLPCCYNYWIDLSTDAGRANWSLLLAKIQAGQSIWVFVPNQPATGAVYFGDLG